MTSAQLAGSSILIVEDEYLLADDARTALSTAGAKILGPVPTAEAAHDVINSSSLINCVLLDINLRGEMAFGIADVLQERNIPFLFVTGYQKSAMPVRFANELLLEKPIEADELVKIVEQRLSSI